MSMRLARAGAGVIDYWMGLPILELMAYFMELGDQIEAENKAVEEAAKRR
jgi:hypothetical protein